MAARLERDLHVASDIIVGRTGEFTVWVGDTKVAEKTVAGFPADDDIVEQVRQALAGGPGAR